MGKKSVENVETVEFERRSGPTVIVERVATEVVQQGGLITANVAQVEQEIVNPWTLPTGEPRPMPRRRARR